MRLLSGDEEKRASKCIDEAAAIALKSTCQRDRCGSILIKGDEVIGRGCNSPPKDQESQRRCSYSKEEYHKKVTDKTCCVHAEQRAILDALKKDPAKVSGSRLYFMRINDKGQPSQAGDPYCTICSKMALDAGVAEFVLWRQEGIVVYDTEEYNLISFQYKE